jgi:hypothetical protein
MTPEKLFDDISQQRKQHRSQRLRILHPEREIELSTLASLDETDSSSSNPVWFWREGMPIHSVVVTNNDGIVLFNKYYDQDVLSTLDGRSFFESYLFRHTKGYWSRSNFKQTVSFL